MKGSRSLTDQEIESVLSGFQGDYALRNRLIFLLGIKCGYRISEVLSIRVGDVFKNGRVLDRVVVHRKSMKRKQEGRSVVLHPVVRALIEEWLNKRQENERVSSDSYLFCSRNGQNQPLSRVQAWRVLNEQFENLGLIGKLGTHAMRKTFAERVYERLDRDLVKTQKALAHKNINSTVAYLSFKQEEIDEAILSI